MKLIAKIEKIEIIYWNFDWKWIFRILSRFLPWTWEKKWRIESNIGSLCLMQKEKKFENLKKIVVLNWKYLRCIKCLRNDKKTGNYVGSLLDKCMKIKLQIKKHQSIDIESTKQ